MNKISYFFAFLCTLTLFIIGCDNNQFDALLEFPFSVEVQNTERMAVDNPYPLKIKIVSEVYKPTPEILGHNFQWTSRKNLIFLDAKGDTIKKWKDTNIRYSGVFENYKLIPKEKGIDTLKLSFINTKGVKVKKIVPVEFFYTSFKLNANASKKAVINVSKDLNLYLTEPENTPKGTSYRLKYQLSNLIGKLKDPYGNPIDEGASIEFDKERKNYTFVASEVSDGGQIFFTAIDNRGKTSEAKLDLQILKSAFSVATANTNKNWTIEEQKEISMIITPDKTLDKEQNFEITYYLESGKGEMEGFSQNVYKKVSQGESKLKFTPSTTGDIKINFSVRNQDGTEEKNTLTLKIDDPAFEFSTTAQKSGTTINTPIDVAYTLKPKIGKQKFQVKFEVSNMDARLNEVNQGIWFDIKEGNGKLSYKPMTEGNHQVTVTVRNNFGVENQSDFSVTVAKQNFNFTATSISNIGIVSNKIPQNFTLSPEGDDQGQVYQMQFLVEGGSGTLQGNNAGSWFVVEKGGFSLNYTPTTAGTHKITYKVKNSAGTEQIKTVNIMVSQPDFIFSATSVKNTLVLFEEIDINSVLEAIGDDLNTNYTLTFSSDKQVTIDGKYAGVPIKLKKGSFKMKLKALEISESNNVILKVKNDYGVEKTATLNVKVQNPDFNFSASSENPNIVVDEVSTINYDISEIGTALDQNYMFKYEILEGGVGEIQGYTAAIYTPIKKGVGKLKFIAKKEGNIKVKFTVKNTSGTEKSVTLAYMASIPEFDFTTGTPPSEGNIDEDLEIPFTIVPKNSQNQTYKIMLQTSANASINNIAKDTWIDLNYLNGTLRYKSRTQGANNITLIVKNQLGVQKSVTLSLTLTSGFSISGTPNFKYFYFDQYFQITPFWIWQFKTKGLEANFRAKTGVGRKITRVEAVVEFQINHDKVENPKFKLLYYKELKENATREIDFNYRWNEEDVIRSQYGSKMLVTNPDRMTSKNLTLRIYDDSGAFVEKKFKNFEIIKGK